MDRKTFMKKSSLAGIAGVLGGGATTGATNASTSGEVHQKQSKRVLMIIFKLDLLELGFVDAIMSTTYWTIRRCSAWRFVILIRML